MGLYTPAMLSYWLGDAVLDVRPGAAEPHCEGGIKLLDPACRVSVYRHSAGGDTCPRLRQAASGMPSDRLQRQVRGRNASRCAYAD